MDSSGKPGINNYFPVYMEKTKKANPPATLTENNSRLTITEILQPATIFSEADDKTFYNILRNCIWNFFTVQFDLTGSKMNKSALSIVMKQKGVTKESEKKLLEILDQCETGIFTNVESAGEKKKLLEETKKILVKISDQSN